MYTSILCVDVWVDLKFDKKNVFLRFYSSIPRLHLFNETKWTSSNPLSTIHLRDPIWRDWAFSFENPNSSRMRSGIGKLTYISLFVNLLFDPVCISHKIPLSMWTAESTHFSPTYHITTITQLVLKNIISTQSASPTKQWTGRTNR